ncbi:hypothetical protein [Streptomyces ossamyceticus]|uniref:hypothetical protein n=1 Tax=Streptomyces ossamyceticus TaxID=249581 RepID=UPI000AAE1E7E|nr:hypothetical protein [Streptomyces ossamyceticus]
MTAGAEFWTRPRPVKSHFAYGPWVGIVRTSKVACGATQRYFVTLVDYQTR